MAGRVMVVSQVAVITGEVSGLAMPVKIVLFPRCSQGIQVSGWQDAISGQYINVTVGSFSGAQLAISLLDENGNAVPECNDVSMSYVIGSNGNWQGTFGDENFQPAVGSGYTLVVDGNDGGGDALHLELVAQVGIGGT